MDDNTLKQGRRRLKAVLPGSPASNPYRTRDEAEREGVTILAAVLATMAHKEANPAPMPDPVFLFRDVSVRLSAKVFAELLEQMPEVKGGYGSVAAAVERIKEFEELHLKGAVSAEEIRSLPGDTLARFTSILHIAALSGIQRYPVKMETSPSGHAPPERGKPN